MRTTDPIVMFLLVLAIGIVAGILFDRLAGPSWLARQFSGSTRGISRVHLSALPARSWVITSLCLRSPASVIAAAAGAALVLFVWRMAK